MVEVVVLSRTGRCSRFAVGRGLGRTRRRARAIARCGIVYPLDSVSQYALGTLVQTAEDGDALNLVVEPRQLVSDHSRAVLAAFLTLSNAPEKAVPILMLTSLNFFQSFCAVAVILSPNKSQTAIKAQQPE